MPEAFWSFVLTATLIELTPGPNMVTLAILAATHGRAGGLAAVLGVAIGLAVVGLLSILGLAAIVETSPLLWEALRWAGVGYLLWLALEAWRGDEETSPHKSDGALSLQGHVLRGLVTNTLNPKAFVFYIALLPRFVDQAAPAPMRQTAVLTAAYVIIATIVHTAIVVAADAARRQLASDRMLLVRRVLALLLAAVAIWLAVAGKRA